ncbi:unnamed protein product [Durusdinium trenchii]|uniref:Uncharacterized protein n=1 Tax=Durusdinium trenchii TaxID=1381693 RepID=A0ABP0LLA4_9DINO
MPAESDGRTQDGESARSRRQWGFSRFISAPLSAKGTQSRRTNELISKVGGKNLAESGRRNGLSSRLRDVQVGHKTNGQHSQALGSKRVDVTDVAENLGLSADPTVQEIGDEKLLNLRKSGTLDPNDDAVIAAFKKHKATIGKALFEAENANNLGVQMYLLGDYSTAGGYFEQALELTSEKKKPAAAELAVLKSFVNDKYGGNEDMLYTDLVQGEWRSALGRRKFVEALQHLNYPGDPDRVFSMLDSVSNDGKVSLPELTSTLKAKRNRLNNMDQEPVQKGVVLSNLGCCSLQSGDATSSLQKFREAAGIVRRNLPNSTTESDTSLAITTNIAVAYIHLEDTDSALQYLSVALEKREAIQGHLHDDVLNILHLTGYCFLVKASIANENQSTDHKKQDNPMKANYNFALCAFKERLLRQQEILSSMPELDSLLCDVGARNQLELHIARSHEIIAEIHDKCEDLERAREHLIASLQYKRRILDAVDPDLFSTLNVYASVCSRSGKNKEALEAINVAMAAAEELFGFKSAAVATQLFHTSLIYLRTARESRDSKELLDQAAEQLEQCLNIRKENYGLESEEVAVTAQLLGNVCFASGKFKVARRNFEKALQTRTAFGRENPTVASSAHALGSLYARMPRRQEEAIVLLGKAASIRKEQLGEDSVHLADTLHELGSAIMRRKTAQSLQQALAYLSQAAAIRAEKLGKRNLDYSASLHQLGQVHLHLGQASEAILYLQAALSLRERLVGRNSAQVAASKAALGVACANHSELDKAFKLLKLAYKQREKLFGQNHALPADTLQQIGLVMIRQGKLDASLAPLLQALKVFKQLNSNDVAERLEDSDDSAALVQKPSERSRRIQAKRSRKGKPIETSDEEPEEKRKSIGFMAKIRSVAKMPSFGKRPKSTETAETEKELRDDGEDSEVCIEEIGVDTRGCFAARLATSMQTLADVYMKLRDLNQSKFWLDRSVCIREELFGTSSAEFGESMHRFGLLKQQSGSTKASALYLRKALRARERSCGYSHPATAETCEQLAQVLQSLGKREEAGIFMNKALAIRESLPSINQSDLAGTREKSHQFAANAMEYDPVQQGEIVPHISKRSAESYLHGWRTRTTL